MMAKNSLNKTLSCFRLVTISCCLASSLRFDSNMRPKFSRLFSKSCADDFEYSLIRERVVFPTGSEKAWRKVVRREVCLPNDKIVEFDIITQGSPSIVVFIWDTASKTTTLIREYQPGSNQVLYGTVAGMYEPHKHDSPLQCAQYELEEEAQLSSDTWIPLLASSDTSIPFDKYSDNRFYPYLVLDCKTVKNPKPLDDTEFIKIKPSISHSELMEIISTGSINIASSFAILLGLKRLELMGFL